MRVIPGREHTSNPYYRPCRIPAADTCAKRGWLPATILASSKWAVPRTILAIEAAAIALTTSTGSVARLKTLPEDVAIILHKDAD